MQPVICCKMAVVLFLLQFVDCSDDYEYLKRVEAERIARSQTANNLLDGLYSVESASNKLYLTARNGYMSPGSVVLKKFSDSASQLWEVNKFDTSRGYGLKPLANEFNSVTSTLTNNAHAYNAWEFKQQSTPHTFIIFNTLNKRCLQTASFDKAVKFEKCKPTSINQHWKLNKIQ